jgi:hypothetical protein
VKALLRATAIVAPLLLALAAKSSGELETVCVTITTPALTRAYPAHAGEMLRIGFNHSIYGSRIEETFQIAGRRFEPVVIHYSEPRLVDFYGYESATRAADWWVVRPARRSLESLTLAASRDAYLYIAFGPHTLSLTDGVARIEPSSCSLPHD